MRRFSILAAVLLGLALSVNSASAQTTFAVQTPVVSATTAVTPVAWRGYYGGGYYRPYGAYYRPYGAYYRPYGAYYGGPYWGGYGGGYYRPYGAYYRPYGYGFGVRPYVGVGVY